MRRRRARPRKRLKVGGKKKYDLGCFKKSVKVSNTKHEAEDPPEARHGARLFMHAALQGGQGFIATVYIDGSDEGRPLKSNGRVPG